MTGVQTCDRKSTRLNSSHTIISYAVFCLKKEEAVERPISAPGIAAGAWGIVALRARRGTRGRAADIGGEDRVAGIDHRRVLFFLNNRGPAELHPLPLPRALPT